MKKLKKKLNKKVRGFDMLDIKLIKWSTLTFTLFLLTVWPWLRNLVLDVHWAIWLVLGILFSIRPIKKYFS